MVAQHILFHLDILVVITFGRCGSSSSVGIDRAGLVRSAASQFPTPADPGPGGGGV
jgi:hypothetical protein